MTDWASRLALASLPDPVLARAKLELDRAVNETADRRELDQYLETLLAVPWDKLSASATTPTVSVEAAKGILAHDHIGLARAKDRVLEEVAIRILSPDAPQPLFFLVGPPYTGKTHFARSIATLFGRPFIRRSLTGVSRESDLRGRARAASHPHPGLFIDAIIEAGVRDPVIYLEDAEDLGISEGNPLDALLSAMDNTRSKEFLDRYLAIPLDLSRAMIILSGQGESLLSPALAGRVTAIEFAGYTVSEKEAIARRNLLPAQIKSYGLERRLRVSERALRDLIEGWTYEPGVGQLAAALNVLARDAALELASGHVSPVSIAGRDLTRILGPRPLDTHGVARIDRVGVINGLVMNAVEGAVTVVEASAYKGHGELIVTGSVGPVMRESIQVALTVIRQPGVGRFALPQGLFDNVGLHLHFPATSTEKEGPSAGAAIAVAIFSRIAGIPVRHDLAMTGELDLAGSVLRIGGLKKKILGAHRAGAKIVLIPAGNAPDLVDIPPEVRADLEIVLVTKLEDALRRALISLPPMPVRKTPRDAASSDPSDSGVHDPSVAASAASPSTKLA
jgi:ATP-dependent Lon protease